ncbi:MAG: pilus assembly protein TadG-related protein [Desulfitobacteriaceae bacterium]|nr:pilus assembly protein TadG-related protein [Desulfitobacteriaceae bacterium]
MKFLPNEKGQMIVLLALGLAVFCGLAGLSIDVGNLYWQKSKLQSALDASCLAGAQALPDTIGAAETKLKYYAKENGVENGVNNTVFTFDKPTDVKIRATATRKVRLALMPVLGFGQYANVTAKSAAIKKMNPAFNYVVFNGSETEPMKMYSKNKFVVNGSIHSNSDIIITGKPQNIKVSGSCEAVGDIDVDPNASNISKVTSEFIEMPSYADKIKAEAYAAGAGYYYTESTTLTDTTVSRPDPSIPIYVEGDLTIDCTQIHGSGAIMATGNITMATNNIHGGPLFIYSLKDISVDTNNIMISGIFYAPNGSIKATTNVVKTDGALFIAAQVKFGEMDDPDNNITMAVGDNSAALKYGDVSLVPYD